jgi:TRAP-type mannitol/chloroaromatic compound transport system substrate-binding protein
MQSSWPAADFHQVNPKGLVEKIAEMTGGRLQIDLQPAGTVVPAFEVLDAVNRGVLDAGHSWPGFWTGKHPAATLFGSAPGGPYGMNAEDYLGWVYLGGGLELYNELLQKELKLNSQDLVTLVTKHGVTVVETPREVFEEILKAWDKVAERKAKENAFFARVLESQKAWAQRVVPYRRCCHPPYEFAADYYWKGANPYKILKQP